MEAYPFDSPPRSSNSLPKNDEQHRRRPSSSHISSLYSLRKKMNAMTPKRPCKKMPIAPMPPVPKRVYKVDAADFKAVVQELTGAPAMAAAPSPAPAPAPLGILPDADCHLAVAATPPNDEDGHMSWPFLASNLGLMSEAWMDHAREDSPEVPTDQSSGSANSDPFGLSAEASSHGWFSVNYHVLSPGTMASLEPINSVLYN